MNRKLFYIYIFESILHLWIGYLILMSKIDPHNLMVKQSIFVPFKNKIKIFSAAKIDITVVRLGFLPWENINAHKIFNLNKIFSLHFTL
jgi:hypothetical protein